MVIVFMTFSSNAQKIWKWRWCGYHWNFQLHMGPQLSGRGCAAPVWWARHLSTGMRPACVWWLVLKEWRKARNGNMEGPSEGNGKGHEELSGDFIIMEGSVLRDDVIANCGWTWEWWRDSGHWRQKVIGLESWGQSIKMIVYQCQYLF